MINEHTYGNKEHQEAKCFGSFEVAFGRHDAFISFATSHQTFDSTKKRAAM